MNVTKRKDCRLDGGISNEEKLTKAKRHDIEIKSEDIDTKLAAKLDAIMRISDSRKPKFLTNRTKAQQSSQLGLENDESIKNRLIRRDLSKEAIRERVRTKYDTLVPELDPDRPKVILVKILSASESVELGKDQARKQMERQLELNSVSGNAAAFKGGLSKFIFNDGYEVSANESESMSFQPDSILKQQSTSGTSKKVSFAPEAEGFVDETIHPPQSQEKAVENLINDSSDKSATSSSEYDNK